MDPASWAAAIGTIGIIATAIIAYIKWQRGKIENLAQSEADSLKYNLEHPDRDGDKLFLDKPKPPIS